MRNGVVEKPRGEASMEKAHNHTVLTGAPASATACTRPGQRQDRSSSLRCGRSVLTRPSPGAAHTEAESPQNHRSLTC
ncbi:MAG: hypothetical protein QOI39_1710 [Mycobacterium sp.]|jgi:hypothetical protein|nr:hypothetical protein [Mycobacterium sp.]